MSEPRIINRTVTVAQVLKMLTMMGDTYEQMCLGRSPTGNYGFKCSPVTACETMRAAHSLILQLPVWIPVSERLPVDIPHGYCLVTDGENVGTANYSIVSRCFDHCIDRDYWKPTHWMPLPAPPEVTP